MTDNAPKTKPADKLKDGGLTLTIWPQATKEGHVFHTAVLTRTYKVGKEFKETASIGGRDMLKASELMRQGYNRIQELDAAANKVEQPETPGQG